VNFLLFEFCIPIVYQPCLNVFHDFFKKAVNAQTPSTVIFDKEDEGIQLLDRVRQHNAVQIGPEKDTSGL
jgi:hypothetical protein